ncbi:MAG: V-type ATP synthase subunit I, partial [Simkaniaceae bacterium]|nr:V-type ATP synthase subunit I [Simkaniaceae bacterium]
NSYYLDFAKEETSTHLEGALFSIEGWVPKNKVYELFHLLQGLGIHTEEVSVSKEDKVPTCMMNKKTGQIGEDIVHVYDTPATNDKDPSKWVLWSFAIFYAIIIADAGYGLIYLAGASFLNLKFSKTKGLVKRFLKLLMILSCSIVIWGILTASYFGMNISPKNPIKKYSAIQALVVKKANYHIRMKDDVYDLWVKKYPQLQSVTSGQIFLEEGSGIVEGKMKYEVLDEFYDNILMEIALIIGIIHISLSFIRYLPRSLSGIGWVGFMIGGFLFFPDLLNATSIVHFLGWITKPAAKAIGLQLLYGGIGLAVFLAFIQSKWSGLAELTRVVEIFADILSYLRLYALGLAGMILASTFNDLGREAGYVFGVLIVIMGHVINLVIGAMGGIIHGLRLNFIEWYHYSFEGGGKLFNPLKLLKYK